MSKGILKLEKIRQGLLEERQEIEGVIVVDQEETVQGEEVLSE